MTPARILIIEDEAILAADLQYQLEDLGYTVTGIADTARGALEATRRLCPDLILMDIRLKGPVDGISAAEMIRREFSLPIVFLTAYSDAETLERAKRTQPFGYLCKPFEEKELVPMIEISLQRHSSEKKLRESEERYRVTINSIGDGIITVDQSSRVTLLNPAAERITGWTTSEAKDQPLTTILPLFQQDDGQKIPDPSLAAMQLDRTVSLPVDAMLQTRDGRLIPVENSSAPIHSEPTNAIAGAVVAFRDTTEKRSAERMVRNLQKLESLGVLAGGIAHDFNNLLSPIMGYAEMLRERLRHDPIALDMVNHISVASKQAARLTQKVLISSGNAPPEPEILNLKAEVRQILGVISGSLSPHTTIEFESEETLPALEGDPAQICQLVMNLLTNASESLNGKPGVVRIRISSEIVESARLRSEYLATTPPAGEYLILEVSDTGSGMDANTLQRIFDPFFTTKFTGRGLGLSAVLGIIQTHHGSLNIQSAPGKGTTFRIFLPIAANDLVRSRSTLVDAPGAHATALLMESDPSIRQLLEMILSMAGIRMLSAVDPAAMLTLLRQPSTTVDLVMMDLMGKEGMQWQQVFEAIPPGIPVIFIGDEETQRWLQFTFISLPAALILKPFRPADVLQTVQEVLRRAASQKNR